MSEHDLAEEIVEATEKAKIIFERMKDESRAKDKKIKELEVQIAVMREALEKLNFDDEKIRQFMVSTNSQSVIAVLTVVGQIARSALNKEKP